MPDLKRQGCTKRERFSNFGKLGITSREESQRIFTQTNATPWGEWDHVLRRLMREKTPWESLSLVSLNQLNLSDALGLWIWNHLNFCHSLGRVFWIHFQSSHMPLMLPPGPISCHVDFKGFLNVPFSFNQFRLQLIKFQQKESLFSIFEGSPALPSSVTTYIISH